MKITDREDVILFLGKVQVKIAELGGYIAIRKHDTSSLLLCKELIDVVGAITHCRNNWSESTLQKVMDYYNIKAELNDVPYVKIVGYDIRVNQVINSGGKTTSVNDLVDYVSSTIDLINNTSHNVLKNIQGGKVGEYYHVDKAMYDWIFNQMNPFTSPSVSLSLSPNVLLREKGTTYTGTSLIGSYTLNSGKTVLKTRYYRGTTLLAEYTNESIGNNFVDNSLVATTTSFKYEVDFEVGGTKSTSKTVEFVLPYYSDIKATGQTMISANKVVSKKPSSLDIQFIIPVDNATTKLVKPYVMYDASWGIPKNVYVNGNTTFDTVNSWVGSNMKQVTKTLVDGTTAQYYLFEYAQYTEGTFTFNFRF